MDRRNNALNCDTIIDNLPPLDVSAEIARMEGRGPENKCDAYLMLRTRRLPVRVEERGRQGMVALVAEEGKLEGKYKLRFPKRGKEPAGVLLVDTIKRRRSGEATRCWFRYMAAWATTEQALLHFLVANLRLGRLPLSGLVRRENGWFYQFPEHEHPNQITLKDRVDEIREEAEKRRDIRIPMDQPVRWSQGGGGGTARTIDVSRKGVHMLALDKAPPIEGDTVTVAYPNRLGWMHLHGEVVWSFEGGSGEGVGGFSMRIDRVDDGENGTRWLRYIKEAARNYRKSKGED